MKKAFLLPNKFKAIGWILLILSVIFWIYVTFILQGVIAFLQTSVFSVIEDELLSDTVFFSVINTNITYTLNGILFIIGGLLVVFSQEKTEDEFISKLRLISFQWSFLINYLLLLFLFFFVYGFSFLNVMIYNMFTMLILFIARFNYLLFKYKNMDYEK
jgi:hypothetical protein